MTQQEYDHSVLHEALQVPVSFVFFALLIWVLIVVGLTYWMVIA